MHITHWRTVRQFAVLVTEFRPSAVLFPGPAAMTNNIKLLRSTLCLNPWIMARVALYGTGLGNK